MSQLLTSQRSFLELFVQAGLGQRKALLQSVSETQLKAISEIVHNVLKGNVPVTSEQQKTLKKYRTLLYTVGDKKITLSQKRRVIITGANPIRDVLRIALEHIPWLTNPS